MEVDNVWVYTPGGSPKTKKDVVYTPMGGSPAISVKVYAHFGGSPKLKVNPFTLGFFIFKITIQDIKNKLENISV